MFFSLSTSQLDHFPYHHILPNGLVLNTDDGWETYTTESHTVVVKGYANQYSLNNIVNNLIVQDIPTYKGNFCAFVADNEHVKILHDTNRGFPLWRSDACITNLAPLAEQVWADWLLTVHSDMKVDISYFNPYVKNTDNLTDEKITGDFPGGDVARNGRFPGGDVARNGSTSDTPGHPGIPDTNEVCNVL